MKNWDLFRRMYMASQGELPNQYERVICRIGLYEEIQAWTPPYIYGKAYFTLTVLGSERPDCKGMFPRSLWG